MSIQRSNLANQKTICQNRRPKGIAWLFLFLCILATATSGAAPWSATKKQAITKYMQQYRHDWTEQDTELMSQGNVPHTEADVYVNGKPINLRLKTDDGRLIPVSVIGESILVDGKDLSGNLGSKTTNGDNSPIIEDVSGSQITTGNSSPISRQSNYTISISLSLALSASIAANLYLLRRMKTQKTDSKRPSNGTGL
jgi:hypothetical protein